jgi:hypothetical protein
MTVLARAGIPGLGLWLLLGVSWYAMMMRDIYLARLRKEKPWASFFIFIASYVAAIIINASFDVALEGPMLGIWFWTLIGIGIGGSLIYHAQEHSQTVWTTHPFQESRRDYVFPKAELRTN